MSFSDLKIKSGGKFLKIEAGEPHDIRLYSDEPIERIIHGFGKEASLCSGPGCMDCSSGDEVKQRFLVNVYDHNTQKVQIWEFGTMIAKQLKSLAITLKEEGKTLIDVDLKVEASGSDKNKKYMVTPRMTAKPVPTGLMLHLISHELPF